MTYTSKWIESPVGPLRLVASDRGLVAVLWENDTPKRVPIGEPIEASDHPILIQTERELSEYFAGERRAFSVSLDFKGTEFQKRVWDLLLEIPYGETRTYGQLAEALGNRSFMRAVGAANGRNPISIIAPCHRVIGAEGKLTGFAGGMAAKAWLLRHESGGGIGTLL